MSGEVLGVVPARLSSTRLPRKPLHPLLGKPLIEWVWRRVRCLSVLDHALVATDSVEVADVCRALGAPVELTAPEHPSGTDRVAEVANMPRYRDFEVIVNVQGDEPLVEGGHVRSAVDLVRQDGWQVGTCATPLRTLESLADPSVVKVVRATSGRALYFSRAPIPHVRGGHPSSEELCEAPFLRHIGLYAYGRSALNDWVSLKPSRMEQIEALEQLRPLEAGLRIGLCVVGAAAGGVDTPADVARMEEQLSRLTQPTAV